MLRSFLTGAASLALLLGAFASANSANNPPKISLVQIDLSNPFHLGEVDGAKEAARRAGFELIVTSGEGDVNKQIQAVENLSIRASTRSRSTSSMPAPSARRWPRQRRRASRSSACTPSRQAAPPPSAST